MKQYRLIISLAAALCLSWDAADASYKVSSPDTIGAGTYDLEVRGSTGFDDAPSRDGKSSERTRLYYGLTDDLTASVGASGGKSYAGDAWHLDTVDVGTKLQFWKPGEKSFDAGLQLNVYIPTDDNSPYAWRPRLHLRKSFDMQGHALDLIANLAFIREFGPHAGNDTEYRVSFKAEYDFGHPVVPFVEWHSYIDSTTRGWSDQTHAAGPFVKIPLAEKVYTTIGYLAGLSPSVPDHHVSWRLAVSF